MRDFGGHKDKCQWRGIHIIKLI